MKPGRKKTEHDEPGMESPGSDTIGSDNRNDPRGIDAVRALQIIAGGIAALLLVWIVLHNILSLI